MTMTIEYISTLADVYCRPLFVRLVTANIHLKKRQLHKLKKEIFPLPKDHHKAINYIKLVPKAKWLWLFVHMAWPLEQNISLVFFDCSSFENQFFHPRTKFSIGQLTKNNYHFVIKYSKIFTLSPVMLIMAISVTKNQHQMSDTFCLNRKNVFIKCI